MTNRKPKESVRQLLTGIVDYAGLFPPSQVSMSEAVANYYTYKNSHFGWMLGRFVVPVGRLDEFTEHGKEFFTNDASVWKLSVLASEDICKTVERVNKFNLKNAPFVNCDTLEIKADSTSEIAKISEAVPKEFTNFFEILPAGDDLAELVVELALRKQCAKIRTGGVTVDAFPQAWTITRFIRTCLSANVPFKATAGLHHPIRCQKPLTYEPNAPVGKMFGFLNVFLAAAFAGTGFKATLINQILESESAKEFVFDDSGVVWRNEYFIRSSQLKFLREKGAISFGSCSFEEPVTDLREIGLL